ncbi:MAG: hypothetical protein QNI87_12865 [Erythrobacter sp.]|uniref:hypothetical protein n=1 Tax=Erythrobacter sp. TaxID=1042 RepID=UPI00261942EB|nr:hypothetical protein [Erythrobacter sp.]MDJ0979410.1 hypothetical protein [Erythrobacter sp.]
MKIFQSLSGMATVLALLLPCATHAQTPQCPDPAEARLEVEQTIRDFFDALRGEGEASFESLTTSSMYSFDVGERFEGRALADVIIGALEDGVEINWTLGPMDTAVRCDVAWSQWENTGSAGTPPDVAPVRWLESAVLVYEEGRWKVDFFHSQRARPE